MKHATNNSRPIFDRLRKALRFEILECRAMLASFQTISGNAEYFTRATAVSADGTTLVGELLQRNALPFTFNRSFRWDETTQLQVIDDGLVASVATAVSGDGAIVAGRGRAAFSLTDVAYWRKESGEVERLEGSSSFRAVAAAGVSGDGSSIVGSGITPNALPAVKRAYRWAPSFAGNGGSFTDLGQLPGAPPNTPSEALSVSLQGDVVVGRTGDFLLESFRWQEGLGMQPLVGGTVAGLSGDGLTPVGHSIVYDTLPAPFYHRPVRWRDGTAIPLAPDGVVGEARAASLDGRVIVGSPAFYWTEALGLQSLPAVLTGRYGLDLEGWTLVEAVGISADGYTIVGNAEKPGPGGSGPLKTAWVAHLDRPAIDTDVAILDATLAPTGGVAFTYTVSGAPVFMTAEIYVSSDELFDRGDVRIASPVALSPIWTSLPLQGVFPTHPLKDGSRPFLLIVADPNARVPETDESNNVHAFRIVEGLDRWWSDVPEAATPDQYGLLRITWTHYVRETSSYTIGLKFDNEGENWGIASGATVTTTAGRLALVSSSDAGSFRTEPILLDRGYHVAVFEGISVSTTPIVETATFSLRPTSTGETGEEILNSYLVADFREQSIDRALNTEFAPAPVRLEAKRQLVERFAPLLRFTEDERFPFPFDAETASWSRRFGPQLNERGMVQGSVDDYIDLSEYSPPRSNGRTYSPLDAATPPKIYAALVPDDDDPNQLAINYFFHYPRSDWCEQGGRNVHEGDWEGATVFLRRDDIDWRPTHVALAQHVSVGGFGGGSQTAWSDLDVVFGADGSAHPILYVGLGAHATYSFAGVTTLLPLGDREVHDGSMETRSTSPFPVQYLSRLGSEEAPDWLRYPGLWGQPDVTDTFCVSPLGRAAPRGPVFVESGFAAGTRWLTPVAWSEWFSWDQRPGPTRQPGDATGDRIVDLTDFGILKMFFGIQGAHWGQGDWNGDGVVGLTDFGILKEHFGTVVVVRRDQPAVSEALKWAGNSQCEQFSQAAFQERVWTDWEEELLSRGIDDDDHGQPTEAVGQAARNA